MVNLASSKAELLDRVRELEAEVELYEMMIFDFAAEDVIAAISAKYPALTERWEKPE